MNSLADLTAFAIKGLLVMVVAAIAIFAAYVFLMQRSNKAKQNYNQRPRPKQRKR